MSALPAPAAPDQRARILDTALDLMSQRGAADTSMRTLANACGLNVATLYHYFPSKTDLVKAVISERGWFVLLEEDDAVTFDTEQPLEPRLVAFLAFLSEVALAEEKPVRLLLGEGLRQEPTAVSTVADLLAAIDNAMARWVGEGFPDLEGDPVVQGRAVRHLLVSRLVQVLAGTPGPADDHTAWAREAAAILLGP
jgi:AcrR family transcriptional regulator